MDAEKVIDEVTDYLQELLDYGFKLRTEKWFIRNGIPHIDKVSRIEFILKSEKEIWYDDIYDILGESMDRIKEFYDVENIYIKRIGNSKTSYPEPPKHLYAKIDVIFINLVDKKKDINFGNYILI